VGLIEATLWLLLDPKAVANQLLSKKWLETWERMLCYFPCSKI